MFFKLLNILITLQRYVNKILVKKLDIFIIVYLNNILIYIKDLNQSYIETVKLILD